MPFDLHIEQLATQRAAKVQHHAVTQGITRTLHIVWQAARQQNNQNWAGPRPPTGQELLRARTQRYIQRKRSSVGQTNQTDRTGRQGETLGRRAQELPTKTLIREKPKGQWRVRWQDKTQNKQGALWQDQAAKFRLLLYDSLDKATATALFLLRTEVIGLSAWLAKVGIPGILPRCPCGHPSQTVKHIILRCAQQDRSLLLPELQTLRFPDLLCSPKSAKATAR
jgi:hypothetical protein